MSRRTLLLVGTLGERVKRVHASAKMRACARDVDERPSRSGSGVAELRRAIIAAGEYVNSRRQRRGIQRRPVSMRAAGCGTGAGCGRWVRLPERVQGVGVGRGCDCRVFFSISP